MANNKFYGYNPKPSNNKKGNRLDRVNPYEFRKGMDYELTSIGVSRLAESTPEERETATCKQYKQQTTNKQQTANNKQQTTNSTTNSKHS